MVQFSVLMLFIAMVGVIGAAGVALTLLYETRRVDALNGDEKRPLHRRRGCDEAASD
jgi:hypothetical protein